MRSRQPAPILALLFACIIIAVAGVGGIYAMTLVDRTRTATRAPATVIVLVPLTQPVATSTPAPTLELDDVPTQPFIPITVSWALEPTETQPATAAIARATSFPNATVSPTPTAPSPTPTSTATPSPTPIVIPHPNGLSDIYLPRVSDRARAIYLYGVSHGNDPRAFSRLGDCHSSYPGFLGTFDTPTAYRLGDYAYLHDVIDYFSGSFSHPSQTGYSGLHMGAFFSPLWADPKICGGGEDVMECEYRLRHPSLIFINIGTLNMASSDEQYESFLRRIVEFWLGKSVLPILNTKADDIEGSNRFNNITRRLADEYDIPLWDFWIAAQTLPNAGLQSDLVHLSEGKPYFDDPVEMQSGWTMRNLTGLQALDIVWRVLR